MIQDAQYTTVQEVVGQVALFEVYRKEVSSEPQKPFDSWMDIHTIQEYTRVWKQMLCYVFWAEDEESTKRPVLVRLASPHPTPLRLLGEGQQYVKTSNT
jgi:hypothetical protein